MHTHTHTHTHVHEHTQCKSTERLRFVNTITGEIIRVRCNTYACADCAPRKLNRLRKGMIRYFQNFEYVRLWTFTCTTRFTMTPKLHFDAMRKAWRIFTKELRRNKGLRESQRQVQYVKTVELHKSGYVHFHALFTQYVPQAIISAIWDNACRSVLKQNAHVASAYVRGHKYNATMAAKYVTKSVARGAGTAEKVAYVTKSDDDFLKLSKLGERVKRWSKSNKTGLFPRYAGPSPYVCVKVRDDGSLNLCAESAIEQVPEELSDEEFENALSQIEIGFGDGDPPDLVKELAAYLD